MRKLLTGLAIILSCSLHAQQTVKPLYDGVAPGSENSIQKEVEYSQFGGKMIRNVVNPTLTVYLPEESKATGVAVIVAPGGGFCWLSWESEGTMVGEWLQAHGIAAFILKYRLADMGQTDEELQKNTQEFMQPMMQLLPLWHRNFIKHGCQQEKALSFMSIQKVITALACAKEAYPLTIGLTNLESG
jgi:hypothetical protein